MPIAHVLLALTLAAAQPAPAQTPSLAFEPAEAGYFQFDTGVVRGKLRLDGRAKDMVIRGGENVYPREIEEFLYRHPKVQSAQVFGVPDPKYGEEICAWIVLKPGEKATEDEIRDFCREQIARS